MDIVRDTICFDRNIAGNVPVVCNEPRETPQLKTQSATYIQLHVLTEKGVKSLNNYVCNPDTLLVELKHRGCALAAKTREGVYCITDDYINTHTQCATLDDLNKKIRSLNEFKGMLFMPVVRGNI